MWILGLNLMNVVKGSRDAHISLYDGVHGMITLSIKLNRLKHVLKCSNKNIFGNVFDNISKGEKDVIRIGKSIFH